MKEKKNYEKIYHYENNKKAKLYENEFADEDELVYDDNQLNLMIKQTKAFTKKSKTNKKRKKSN